MSIEIFMQKQTRREVMKEDNKPPSFGMVFFGLLIILVLFVLLPTFLIAAAFNLASPPFDWILVALVVVVEIAAIVFLKPFKS